MYYDRSMTHKMKGGTGYMSKKITTGKRTSLKGTGRILLDCPARVLTGEEITEWSNRYATSNPGKFLFDGTLMLPSLSTGGYTLWKDLKYE